MNARGISVFYGATNESIAIAEVRPPVGSQVVVGRFEMVRPVYLLDVAALESVMVKGSIFDPTYARRLERARFLKRLSGRITMPVMPDEEAVHHLVTQAMADYLVGRRDLNLDGLLYRSVQADAAGHNVMLFHRSARCEAIEVSAGTEIEAGSLYPSEDEAEVDYRVWELVPAPEPPKAKELDGFPDCEPFLGHLDSEGAAVPTATLRLETTSLRVHHVKAVTFKTEVHAVRRRRREQRSKSDF